MKKSFMLLLLCSYMSAGSISEKKFYQPFPYFYHESIVSLNQGDRYYSFKQINSNDHIRNKMGFCITEYEIYDILHFGCNETFNTLKYYVTQPKGLLRKDILEFYHDMPLEDYESTVKTKRKDKNAIRAYRSHYRNHLFQKQVNDIQNKVLEDMRNELRR